jgi:signal transduction protein with GAF and PtsI domain
LSMNSTNLTKVKKVLRNLSCAEADAILQQVMTLQKSEDVLHRLEQFLVGKGMANFIHARLD